ncbi:MAG: nicotinamide riboside transporter PnuC [Candidatus Pedobacter colombiensis]|uniref:Nicotinamide riboside transporter PnuC n=1 Tax=Candidatus Pedobacter colombiensis TaxID=3121371 RepID=A0AAJ6B8S9_9SPHI|nr:nicotinamide riboside transporter PnuC [Pedobacter sp.]WEK19458.1 MAG: nicotinamide riboside transporter PnuC [Pedobacter sp.]
MIEILKDSFTQLFIQTDPLEWFGVFTGILCVWLAAKNNIYNWPIAIISVVIYIFIFFESKLYADMGLQFYFFIMNVYGWYYWSKNRNNPEASRPVANINKKEILLSIIGVIAFTILLGQLLYKNTDAAFPYIDSFCTACSLVAQIFLARKVIQNWMIWIFVDIIYVGMYISKDLYATAVMYALYVYIASVGYLDWRKIYREQAN